jgi:Secretion system C-terminal sorting domain/FG-GAP-like repeat
MKNLFSWLSFIIFNFLPYPACCQLNWYFSNSSEIEVIHGGEILKNPWSGGINAAQLSKIDLNLDGKKDIFIFDRTGNKITTLINNDNTAGAINYSYTNKYNNNFPELKYWALLRDYNCDGLEDIFTYSKLGGGFDVYKNTSTIQNGLSFELAAPLLQSFFDFGEGFDNYYTQVYCTSDDIPAVFDYENDGDLDIFTFKVGGSLLEFHKNFSVENFGNCDSLDFKIKSRCYGQFKESFENNGIELDITCPFNVTDPELILDSIHNSESGGAELRHAGSTILTLDVNNDGLKDLVLGDVTFNNLVLLVNDDGPNGIDSIAYEDIAFPSNYTSTIPVDLSLFPSAYYEDIDNDNVKDLVVCTNSSYAGENRNSMWFYKNTGQNELPNFQFIKKDLFQEEMIEVGEACQPVFFDYNNDGLKDLFIANRGYYVSDGVYSPQIAQYKNTGSLSVPQFTLISLDYENLSVSEIGNTLQIQFFDIDGDSDKDLLISDFNGSIYNYKNIAALGADADFELNNDEPFLKDNFGIIIDVGANTTPFFFDLNNDGLEDLLIGEKNKNVNYYQNIGDENSPLFTLINDTVGEIQTSFTSSDIGNSNPYAFRLNDTTYIVCGTEAGNLILYNNIDGNLEGSFNILDSNAFVSKNGTRSTILLDDINNDGLMDLFMGNMSGGLLYYKGVDINTGVNYEMLEPTGFNIFPNPTQEILFIDVPDHLKNVVFSINYNITDLYGRKIVENKMHKINDPINISDFQIGFYFIQIKIGNQNISKKLIKN